MTKYLNPVFHVTVGGQKYADGWERTFGKKEGEDSPPEVPPKKKTPDDGGGAGQGDGTDK